MPLPNNDIPWPPRDMQLAYAKMTEWAAWYSGDPDRIIDAYAPSPMGSGSQTPWYRFWSRARAGSGGSQRALLHVPVASDLAAVSGALLFGEAPKIRVRPSDDEVLKELAAQEQQKAADKAAANPFVETPAPAGDPASEATPGAPGVPPPPAPKAPPVAPAPSLSAEQKTERRLLDIMEEGDFYSRLVEAAETSAAIGGVYVYPVWDEDLRGVPIMAVAQADMALPEFRWGFLVAVTLWRAVEVNGNRVVRHVERHEVEGTGDARKAVVLNGLYLGSPTSLGTQVPLTEHAYTRRMQPRVELPFPDLDVEYVPNIRPNRLWRSSGLGVADIQGSETMLDALDEVYASWMRDVRLAKARIIVPRDYLKYDPDDPTATQAGFDLDQEIYTTMDMEPGLTQDARAMMAHQFQIRWQEHQSTAMNFIDRIVSNAGYVPGTLGSGSSGATNAAALRISEHKTILTLRRKAGWWRTAISNVLYHMLLIDAEVFKTGVEAIRPTVLTSDSIIENPLELAQTALALKTAESASVETRVRLVHPDWSGAEVAAEVALIKGDLEAAKPAVPAVSSGSFGNPKEDPASTSKLPTTQPTNGKQDGPPPPPQVPAAK